MTIPMKVYLASSYSRREELIEYRGMLNRAGVVVTSTWLDGEENKDEASRISYARQDLADVDKADMLILFTESRDTPMLRGGKMVEAGYAIGRNKTVIVVGPAQCIFLEVPDIKKYPSFKEFLQAVKDWPPLGPPLVSGLSNDAIRNL